MDVHYSTVYFKRLTDKAIYPATDNPQRIRTGTDVQQLKIDSNGLTASIKLFCDFYILCLMRLPAIGDNVYRTGQYTIYYLPY